MEQYSAVTVEIIGVVRSCFKEKFGIPRQPGLVKNSVAYIELLPPYNTPEAVEGLQLSSHIWVQFLFHANKRQTWKSKVKPPRLGGNKAMGVFATRSPIRPNPIGLSVVKLTSVRLAGGVHLHIAEHDLLDGTPVLDIKPYVPYADSIPEAANAFAVDAPVSKLVVFSDCALDVCSKEIAKKLELKSLITQMLAQDPRPAYQKTDESRVYGMKVHCWDVKWRALEGEAGAYIRVDGIGIVE